MAHTAEIGYEFWGFHQLAAGGAPLTAIDEKVLLALEPTVVIAAMQTTIINANMTAYSTAVGPSSRWRNLAIFFNNGRMEGSLAS